ncbi:hypothetical protein [Alcanivorax sp. 1008]|uniref:hypothetical protein n=1 Tax=Alcanivorax sp. 1008 TaxID=2816853 RepID=UPI001D878D70|nr:hypothetical protein [Alcanivorax sp. 1008]MCC1496901.1 hypothetical protein [Alcanivorax sp. 1008]
MKNALKIIAVAVFGMGIGQAAIADKCNSPAADSECVRFGATEKASPGGSGGAVTLISETGDMGDQPKGWTRVLDRTIQVEGPTLGTFLLAVEYLSLKEFSATFNAPEELCYGNARAYLNGEEIIGFTLKQKGSTVTGAGRQYTIDCSTGTPVEMSGTHNVYLPAGEHHIYVETKGADGKIYTLPSFAFRLVGFQ